MIRYSLVSDVQKRKESNVRRNFIKEAINLINLMQRKHGRSLYTSDAADEYRGEVRGGRRTLKNNKKTTYNRLIPH